MKKYLLCYYHWKEIPNGQACGFGNMTFETDPGKDMFTASGILSAIECVKEKNNFDGVVILNIIPLNN